MYEVGTAVLQIIPSIRGLQEQIEREVRGANTDRAGRDAGDNYTRGFGGAAKKLTGILAAAFAGAQVVDFGKDAIANASDMQEVGTKLTAVFGEAASEITAFGAQGAKALGQTSLQAQNAAATFGTFGKAAGLSAKDNAAFSTELAKLATDMASFSNTTPEDAIEALGSGLRGEAEPLRKYGVLLDDATLRNEALSQGLITSTKEALTPANKVLAARGVIMKQTADAQGDFERTSGGLANQQRILTAQWEDMKGKLGVAFLPGITGIVSGLNDKLFPVIDKAIQKMPALASAFQGDIEAGAKPGGILDRITGISYAIREELPGLQEKLRGVYSILAKGDFTGGGIGEEDSPFVGFLLDARKKFTETVEKIRPDLQAGWRTLISGDTFGVSDAELGPITQIAKTLHDTFSQVFETLAPAFKELLPALSQLLPLLNPVGLVFKSLTPILPQIADMLGLIATTLADVLAQALVSVGPLIETIVGAFQSFMPIIADLVASLLPPLLGLFKSLLPILPPIAKVITELAKVLAEGLAKALTAIAPLFQTLVGVVRLLPFIAKLIESLLPPLLGLFDRLAPLLGVVIDALIPIVDAIVAALIPAIEALLPVVEIVLGFIVATFTNLMTVVSGVIDVIVGLFTGDWEKLWEGVKGIFEGVWNQIGNIIGTIGALFYEFFTNLGPKIWGILTGLASTIVGWGTQFLQWVFDGIIGLFPKMLDWASQFPEWLWEKIWALASTIVSYGSQFLQWIWDGITDLFPEVLAWFGALPGEAWSMITALTTTIVGYGSSFITWIKDGIVSGATAIWDFFTGLPANIGMLIVQIGTKLFDLGKEVVSKIVDGIVSVAGAIWEAITNALTGGSDTSNPLSGGQAGVVFGGSARGGVIRDRGTGRILGSARGGVIPGQDPGRYDNVLATLPDGTPWGLRSRESVFVPEFTDWVGGAQGVSYLNRMAERGKLPDVGLGGGFATGGIAGTYAEAKKYGSDAAWARAREMIEEAKKTPVGLGEAPPGARGEFMKAVASQMGLPYVWGGASPPNFDCSGLMSWGLQQAGFNYGRLTAAAFGDRFPRVQTAKPGDMAIFDTGRVSPKAGHIGMVLDPAAGTMMHTDGAGPSRISDYTRRGGLMGIIDAIGGSYSAPGSSVGSALKGFAGFGDLIGKARQKLGVVLNNSVGPSGEPMSGGAGVERWRPMAMQALQTVGSYLGRPLTQHIDRMLLQMSTESSGNPNAINLTDSNARKGTPSKGLLQTIDPTFQTALRGTPWAGLIPKGPFDPWANMLAAIMYGEVTGPYHSLARAFRGVAYAKGGIVPGMPSWGDSVPALLTPGEGVFTQPQTDAIVTHAKALERGFGGEVPNIQVFIGDKEIMDDVRVIVGQGFQEFSRALPLAKAQR